MVDTNLERLAHQRWKVVNYLTAVFWRRWMKEYLPTLQTRQKWISQHRNFVKEDLVIIVTECVPKGQWPLGLIEETIEDSDGMVRTVVVKTSNGRLKRDIRKICLLEGVETTVDIGETIG